MDFFIIANAWSAGRDNPTSKHRIALELVRQGHRVLWIEGSGMRTPSVGSSHDRLRMVRKVAAALRGARSEIQLPSCQVAELLRENPTCPPEALRRRNAFSSSTTQQPSNLTTALWILSPLFIPLPRYELVRRLNGLICRWSMRFWGWRLGFKDPVLINYVPVLAEAMRGWRRASVKLPSCQVAELLSENSTSPPEDLQRRKTSLSSTTQQPNNSITGTPRAVRVVYHCVDRWDAFAMYDSAMMGEMDRRCCRYADLVIASAGELYERCKTLNPNTVLIPHGVDWEHFRRSATEMQTIDPGPQTSDRRQCGRGAPAFAKATVDMPRRDSDKGSAYPSTVAAAERASHIEGKTPKLNKDSLRSDVCGLMSEVFPSPAIGFFGLLSEWVDQELLLRLAREFPDASLVLIGKADVPVTRLEGIPNIHLAGPKPFSELPFYISSFTVGIIPFVVNDLTRSVNPIKLREMLSAGCPVVSTALPEVARYGAWSAEHRPQTSDLRPQTPDRRQCGRGAPAFAKATVDMPRRDSDQGSAYPSTVAAAERASHIEGKTQKLNKDSLRSDVCGLMSEVSLPAVQIAHTHDEFVEMVRRVLAKPFTADERRAVSDAMADETWTAKVGEILALVAGETPRPYRL